MDLRAFWNLLYDSRPAGSYLLVWRPIANGGRSHWFDDPDKAAEFVKKQPQGDIYFQVALSGAKHGNQRNSIDEKEGRPVAALPALFADIDFGREGHKKADLPPTMEAALSLVEGYSFDPTVTVCTGHGLHCYWVFKECWALESAAERQEAAALLRRLKARIQAEAANRGWRVDSVQDLVRVLRPPESWNCKGKPVQAYVLKADEARCYNPGDLDEFLPDDPGEERAPVERDDLDTSDIKATADLLILSENRRPKMSKFAALQAIYGSKFIKTWTNDRANEPKFDASPSGYDLALATFAARAGWTAQEIVDLLIAHRVENNHALKLKNRQYYARTVLRAKDAVVVDDMETESAMEQIGLSEKLNLSEQDPPLEKLRKQVSLKLGLEILRIEKYCCEPAEYRLYTPQNDVMLKVEDVFSQTLFCKKMMSACDKRPCSLKPREWETVSQKLLDLAKANEVELSDQATDVGEIRSWIEEYLDGKPPMGLEEAIDFRNPFIRDGRWHLFVDKFFQWIQSAKRGEKVSSKELIKRLRRAGCSNAKYSMVINDTPTSRSSWKVPTEIVSPVAK